jgi:hypothetical membrane protein
MINFFSPVWFKIFAMVGGAAAAIGAVTAALFYRGTQGEPYSPLNHFISELGEVGVSRCAWCFNLGLIISGAVLMPASVNLGMVLPGVLAKLAMIAGVICAFSLALVGVFPMNKMKPHGKAAIAYFRAGLIMVVLFSLAIAFQPLEAALLSPVYALAGLPPIMAFASFLILIGRAYQNEEAPLSTGAGPRPKIWHLAAVEWSIFLTVLLWFLLIALGLR